MNNTVSLQSAFFLLAYSIDYIEGNNGKKMILAESR